MIPQEVFYKASYPAVNKWRDVEALLEACKAGEMALVKEMLQSGKFNLKQIEKHYTHNPLNEACKSGNLELVRYLIDEEKLRGHIKTGRHNTPLNLACESGNLELVKYLIKTGSEFNPIFNRIVNKYDSLDRSKSEWWLFENASMRGSAELIEYLVEVYGEEGLAEGLYESLISACSYKNITLVKYFVENKKIDVNKKSRYGHSALVAACASGSIELVKYLLNNCKAEINVEDKDMGTPIHAACCSGNIDLVKYLMKEHNLNIYEKDDGINLLPAACYGNNLDLVKYLVEELGMEWPNPPASSERGPDLFLAYNGNLDIADYIIAKYPYSINNISEMKEDIFTGYNEDDYKLLVHLIEKHHIELIEESEAEDFIFAACASGYFKHAVYFIEKYNFDVNTINPQKGWTLLHYASAGYQTDSQFETKSFGKTCGGPPDDNLFKIVRYLIEDKKADLNIKGNDAAALLNDCYDGYYDYFLNYLNIRDQNGNQPEFTKYF